jgi:hypothetical protein
VWFRRDLYLQLQDNINSGMTKGKKKAKYSVSLIERHAMKMYEDERYSFTHTRGADKSLDF